MIPDGVRERVVWAALQLAQMPTWYGWGEDDPGVAADCSGTHQEVLLIVGGHPKPGVDLTADALYQLRVAARCPERTRLGSEAYWLTGNTATHVATVVAVAPALVVEAAGAGSDTSRDAVKQEVDAILTQLPHGLASSALLRALIEEQARRRRALARNARVRIRPLQRQDRRRLVVLDPWGDA